MQDIPKRHELDTFWNIKVSKVAELYSFRSDPKCKSEFVIWELTRYFFIMIDELSSQKYYVTRNMNKLR